MANTLTWRNVDAPDFRGTMQGNQIAAQALDRAFSGLSDGLGKFQDWREEQAANAVLSRSLDFTDAQKLREAQASGALFDGIDRSLVGTKAINALDTRAGRLLSDAVAQQGLETSRQLDPLRIEGAQLNNDRSRQDLAFNDMANPLRLDAMRLDNTGKSLSNEGAGIRNRSAQLDYDIASRDDRAKQEALPLIETMRSAASPEDVRDLMQSESWLNASPNARTLAATEAYRMFPSMIGPLQVPGMGAAAPAGSGSAAIAKATANVPVNTGSYNSDFVTSIPFSETRNYVPKVRAAAGAITGSTNTEKADQLLPALFNVESGNNPNAVSAKGARGLGQVMPATGVDPGFGVKPMKDQSIEEQKRFSRDYLIAMLDRYDGDVDKALAAYNAGPQRVDSWIKDQPTSGRTASSVEATTRQIESWKDRTSFGGLAKNYDQLAADTTPTGQLVDKLLEGTFKGATKETLLNSINSFVRKTGASPAMAAAVFEQSARGRGMIGRHIPGFDRIVPNDDTVDELAKQYKDGTFYNAAEQIKKATNTQDQLKQAQQNLAQAEATLQAAISRGAPNLDRYRANRVLAQENLNRRLEAIEDDPTFKLPWGRGGAGTNTLLPSATLDTWAPDPVAVTTPDAPNSSAARRGTLAGRAPIYPAGRDADVDQPRETTQPSQASSQLPLTPQSVLPSRTVTRPVVPAQVMDEALSRIVRDHPPLLDNQVVIGTRGVRIRPLWPNGN